MAEILVIDDDPGFRKLIRMMLEGEGHAVQAASDGEEGVSFFAQHRPDLVITDMIMPNVDGVETIGLLRGLDSTVPIIAVSGGSADVLRLAKEGGAVVTLAKPLNTPALLSALIDVIGRSHRLN